MKIVSFKLKGKMAHFRKVYSNSSALSYFIPPRTTIIGIIAGLLGYERDTYYEDFNRKKCKIAVGINQPVKKSIQTLNYLMIKKPGDFNASMEHHSQTPVELVIPQNIRTGYLEYQIWINHKDDKILDMLEKRVKSKLIYQSSGISLGLGPAYNLGWIEYADIHQGENKGENGSVAISSIMPLNKVMDLFVERMDEGYKLIKEEVPLEFNSERQISKEGLGQMVANLSQNQIYVKPKSYIELEDKTNIMWME